MKISKTKTLLLALAVSAVVPMGTLFAADEPTSLDADSVEYDMQTGQVTAVGNVLMKQGISRVAGAKATYNTKTEQGVVTGNVIAMRENLRVTCAQLVVDGQEHLQASGDVHGTQDDKTFTGELVDYYPNQDGYVNIPGGGVLTSGTDTFTADHLQGWLTTEHYIGIGNAHLVSPSRNMEAGGDQLDYYGQNQNEAILTGNAWAYQDNNTMKSNRLTVYLADNGEAGVK